MKYYSRVFLIQKQPVIDNRYDKVPFSLTLDGSGRKKHLPQLGFVFPASWHNLTFLFPGK
jgi:hypothetical protein